MSHLSDLTAVILAGGLGTRLRSVVADMPKVLAQVCDRPFLTYLLDQLAAAEVQQVVLCTGYLGDQIYDMLGESYRCLRLRYSQESVPLGTGGALGLARSFVRSDPALIMNGDSFFQADLPAFYAWYCQQQPDCALLLTQVSDMQRFGRVHTNSTGKILSFTEKGQSGPGWINTGIYLLSQRVLQTIPTQKVVSLERDMFPAWIGQNFYAHRQTGAFLDIGVPESYAAAAHFFRSKRIA